MAWSNVSCSTVIQCSGNYEGALEALKAGTGTLTPALYPVLSSMLVQCLTAKQPLEPILEHMKTLSPVTTNSLLFFACVDARDEERASTVLQVSLWWGWSHVLVCRLQETDMLDRTIFDQFIASPDVSL